MITPRILSLLIGYALGCISTGYLYGKMKGVDIRTLGSGNTGMTNALRNFGVKAGVITLIGDAGKAILAVFLAWLFFHGSYPNEIKLFELYAGLGAILGHNFPILMKFRGGKGIACTVGMIGAFAIFELPICMGLFFLALVLTKYVSLGSILICLSFFIQTILFGQLGFFGTNADGPTAVVVGSSSFSFVEPYLIELYILAGIVCFLGIARHHANIGRLIAGNENKFSLHPETVKSDDATTEAIK